LAGAVDAPLQLLGGQLGYVLSISANIVAVELLGHSASGAQYGAAMVHYFWIGAIPAMVFFGIVMMPFYFIAIKETGGRCCGPGRAAG
jgi:hypothetical protein